MILVPDALVMSTSFQQYDQFLAENKLSADAAATRQVKQVGARIQEAVTRYFTERNQLSVLKNYAWDFNLVEDPAANAWCMPGGKVVINTGILPLTKDEAGLAVVMGHEIAHAVAKHGNERLSQQLLVGLGGMALDEALAKKSEQTRQIWGLAYGVGTQAGYLLPYSRTHETEADRLGLIFMAMAGYDPNAAIPFWERMAAQSGGASVPEFLSTHPSDQTRIANIRGFLPEAMGHYRRGN
jgi:predicted Zn-dependent protease